MHFYLRLLRGACVFCVPVLADKHILINQYHRLFFYYPPSLFFRRRIHTSYVAVDPKRKRRESISEAPSPPLDSQASPSYPQDEAAAAHAVSPSSVQQDTVIYTSPPRTNDEESAAADSTPSSNKDSKAQQRRRKEHYHRAKGVPLKRARIIITVKRSPEYKQWLDENPKQAIIAAAGGGDVDMPPTTTTGAPSED